MKLILLEINGMMAALLLQSMGDTSASSNGRRAGMKEGMSEDLNHKLQVVKYSA